MTYSKSYVESAYPLRYWLTFALFFGVPGFTQFDRTGLTHNYGLINQQSLADIVLTLVVATGMLGINLLDRGALLPRHASFQKSAWLSLACIYAIATIFEPQFRVLPKPGSDLYLSFYRIFQWILAFGSLLSLYTREPVANSFTMIVHFIARLTWLRIGIVWLVLPFFPSMAYTGAGDSPSDAVAARLGGLIVHPVELGVFAAIACFHALFFLHGVRRTVAIGVSVMTLFLTYARGPELTVVLLLGVYLIFLSRGATRLLSTISAILLLSLGILFQATIIEYLARGSDVSNITTLSERTYVWIASFQAIRQRPWIGYGFVAGVKNALRDNWRFAHWIPPHAHNDLIQAAISGGVLAAVLTAIILFVTVYRAIILSRKMRNYSFFIFVVSLLISSAFFAPMISSSFNPLSGVFVCCSLLISDHTEILRSRKLLRDEPHTQNRL